MVSCLTCTWLCPACELLFSLLSCNIDPWLDRGGQLASAFHDRNVAQQRNIRRASGEAVGREKVRIIAEIVAYVDIFRYSFLFSVSV